MYWSESLNYHDGWMDAGGSDGDDGGAGGVIVGGGCPEDRGSGPVHEGWPLRRMAPAPVSATASKK